MKNAAIVILNFNGAAMLGRFLPSVVAHSSHDIWIIDNASSDGSISLLKKDFPGVFIIKLEQNFGYAGGYNRGLKELQGKYLHYILLNSDVEVTPNWDTILINHLEANPNFAAAQPKILSATERTNFDYAGAGGGFLDRLYYPYCRGRIWNQIEEDQGQYDDDCLVDWTSGACFIIGSALFHKLKGFDDHFFAHMEEIDLCLRLRNEGYSLGYTGQTQVYHLGGATLDRGSPRKLELNIRNSLAMIYKNEKGSGFWWIFIQKAILEGLAALGYLLKGNGDLGKAVWRGYISFWNQRKIYQTQNSIKKALSAGPSNYVFLDFFFRSKKKFSEL